MDTPRALSLGLCPSIPVGWDTPASPCWAPGSTHELRRPRRAHAPALMAVSQLLRELVDTRPHGPAGARARGEGGACAGKERASRACACAAAGGGASRAGRWRRRPRRECEQPPGSRRPGLTATPTATPPARHGQRGQPGGRRWRRAAAARRPWPGSGPRRREAAFSTGRRRTAPRVRRCAGARGTTRPRQVSASRGARGGRGAAAGGQGRGSRPHNPVKTVRSDVRPHF